MATSASATRLVLAATLFGFTSPEIAAAKCRVDDATFRERVVLPSARAGLGTDFPSWDVEGATTIEHRGLLKVLIAVRDAELLDPPYFVVKAENCVRGKVVSGYQAWDVALGLRPSTAMERHRPGWLP